MVDKGEKAMTDEWLLRCRYLQVCDVVRTAEMGAWARRSDCDTTSQHLLNGDGLREQILHASEQLEKQRKRATGLRMEKLKKVWDSVQYVEGTTFVARWLGTKQSPQN